MSTPKFTPGPWMATRDLEHSLEWSIDTVRRQIARSNPYHLNGAEADANANLIAASPEMYEALDGCNDAFAHWQIGAVPGRPEDILALITKVRAALAKAEGRQP